MKDHGLTIRMIKERQEFAKFDGKHNSYTCLCGYTVSKGRRHRCYTVLDKRWVDFEMVNFATIDDQIKQYESDILLYQDYIKKWDEGEDDFYGDRPYLEDRLIACPKIIKKLKQRKEQDSFTIDCSMCGARADLPEVLAMFTAKLPWIEYYGRYFCSSCVYSLNIQY